MKNCYRFIIRTLFYAVIMLILIYLFSYLGQNQGNFVYNEF
ncbi:teichoic acid D-Ala incorporation-associated protein DltX [Streptococcus hillyeri]|uniref:Teichoic acid D-Ala incorporation-associated protein DltX n=1 Tax=Streptococcus hillyeri TaxID=2282420 RepID=A0A3L9DP14_9STRE|nr:teichoic acid D-Ala incorporation-associated protein DltX [Streptococcus hillyeri]RLY01857.1 teichoic acid D-Ala incorporation-associated protein DltX [Streptococcus hillyeri]